MVDTRNQNSSPNQASNDSSGNKLKGYLKGVAGAAPIFGAKALLGDLPRSTLGETIEQRSLAKLKNKPVPSFKSVFGKAFTGKGLHQAAVGGGVGILTAPMYLKGIDLLGSEDKKDKAAGLALVGGSASVYQGAKGFGEGYGEAKSRGLPNSSRVPQGTLRGLSRVGLKLPAALLTGAAIAAGRKKKDGQERTMAQKVVLPTILGAVGTAGQGVLNTLITDSSMAAKGNRMKVVKNLLRSPKNLMPAVKGGLVSGALGGLLGAFVIDKALASMKKKSAEGK